MIPNPVLGVLLHAIGGFAAGSFYAPLHKVERWAWESFWLVMGSAAWLVAPWLVAWFTTPRFWEILLHSSARDLTACVFFGALWGVGNLTFGLSVRYLGMALGYAVALGFCMIFGTLVPPIHAGLAGNEDDWARLAAMFTTLAGRTVLGGHRRVPGRHRVLWLGGDEQGSRTDRRAEEGNRCGIRVRQGPGRGDDGRSPERLLCVRAGGRQTDCRNLAGDGHDADLLEQRRIGRRSDRRFRQQRRVLRLSERKESDLRRFRPRRRRPAGSQLLPFRARRRDLVRPVFFYGMGTTKLGDKYDFSSWSIHMAFIIVFSNLWGIAFHEWHGTSRRTKARVWAGIVTLILSTMVIGYGNYLAA